MMRIIIVLYFVLGFAGGKAWLVYDRGCRNREAFAESCNREDGSVFFSARGRTLVVMPPPDERESADADAYIDFMRTDRICQGRVIAGGI